MLPSGLWRQAFQSRLQIARKMPVRSSSITGPRTDISSRSSTRCASKIGVAVRTGVLDHRRDRVRDERTLRVRRAFVEQASQYQLQSIHGRKGPFDPASRVGRKRRIRCGFVEQQAYPHAEATQIMDRGHQGHLGQHGQWWSPRRHPQRMRRFIVRYRITGIERAEDRPRLTMRLARCGLQETPKQRGRIRALPRQPPSGRRPHGGVDVLQKLKQPVRNLRLAEVAQAHVSLRL